MENSGSTIWCRGYSDACGQNIVWSSQHHLKMPSHAIVRGFSFAFGINFGINMKKEGYSTFLLVHSTLLPSSSLKRLGRPRCPVRTTGLFVLLFALFLRVFFGLGSFGATIPSSRIFSIQKVSRQILPVRWMASSFSPLIDISLPPGERMITSSIGE